MHRGRFVALACLAIGASLATTHTSRACIVLAPEVVLPASTAAPRNAHLWFMGSPFELAQGATFALVAAPGAPPAPELDARVWQQSVLVELVPRAPLAASARYDLWALPHKAPWESPKKPPGKPLLVGTFRTGDDTDTTPPAPPAVLRAVRIPAFATCEPSLEIEIVPPTEPAGGDAPLYAIWFAGPDGRIDYAAPPDQIQPLARETRAVEVLGSLHAKVGVRLGVRALDVAGNLSAPVEATVVAR